MHAQSAVFVESASVTGVLGAGKEVSVGFATGEGGDEVGGVVETAGPQYAVVVG